MPKSKSRQSPINFELSHALSEGFLKEKGEGLRKFKGLAYSGAVFSYWGDPCIIDLADISHDEIIPVLYCHDLEKETGHGSLTIDEHELMISGSLLTNEYGEKVNKNADEGFPYQLSIRTESGHVSRLENGAKATVNGQEVTGPLYISHDTKILEVSFTALGKDKNTNVSLLSDDGNQLTQTKDSEMELEEALELIETLKAEKEALEADKVDKQKRIDELEKEAKEANVDAELSQAGFSKKDEKWQDISDSTVNLLLSATDDDRKATIADLANANGNKQGDNPPEWLMSEQHKGGGGNGMKLSDNNPLLANAMARGKDSERF